MTDQWLPSGPLTPTNEWGETCGCAPESGPASADNVIITGSPGAITSVPAGLPLWSIVLNDGTPAADFRIDRYYANPGPNSLSAPAALFDSPMTISRATGVVSFNDPVMLAGDPSDPLEAATKAYVDANAGGIPDAPSDNRTYGRDNGAWVPLPASYMPEAPNNSLRYGRFNSIWQADAIQTDAPGDGATYGRTPNNWSPVLATTGGTISGNLTVTGVLTVNGSNNLVLSDSAGGQRSILGQTGALTRWQMLLGDQAAESLPANGSNFTLNACNNLGTVISTPLSIRRSDGMAAFSGPLNMNAGGAVNGPFALQGPGSLILPGGSAGQFLSTNGSGVLSWATPSGGGITDAPNDGTAYARKSAAWSHLTHTDITDWTATLAPYALTAAVPPASTTTPLADGTAAVGTSTAYARADHVHPSEAASPYSHDNRIINGDMRIDQRNNGAAGTTIGVYTVDRWIYGASLANKGTWQRGAAGAQLTALGFGYFLGFSSSSAYTPLAADQFNFQQRIEADMVSDFCWGTANAQPVTLSFWANCTLAGTFSGSIRDAAGTRSYPFSFTLAASTWTQFAITIPGDTAGAWNMSGNQEALRVFFDLGTGANFRAPAGAWTNGDIRGATGAANIVGTNAAAVSLTGVKLEIGSVATPYNRQSTAKSLADCQRYYQTLQIYAAGYHLVGGTVIQTASFLTSMRATPTATITANGNSNLSSPSCGNTNGGVYAAGLAIASASWLLNNQLTLSSEL